MKLRTKIRLGTIITTTFVLIFVGAIFFLTFSQHHFSLKRQATVKIGESVFQLALLRSEYVAHPNERPKVQWINVYEVQSRLLDQADPLFTTAQEKELFEEIRRVSHEASVLFGKLVENIEQYGSETITEELGNQLTLNAQTCVSNSLRLAELIHEESRKAEKAFLFIVSVLGILVAGISIGHYRSGSNIAESIRVLAEGTNIISGGNLSHQLRIEGHDELGDLARLFNNMATKLQASHATLEKRIQVRTQQLEEEIHNTKKFQLAVQASSDAIAIVHPDMTYLYVNPAWSKLTGYSLQEVKNKTPLFLTSDKTSEKLINQLFAKNAEEEEEEEEAVFQSDQFIYKRKDGSEYDTEIMKYAIREEASVTFYVIIHRNITDRKRTDRAKTEFVSLASHQLRTPLTEIRWALSGLGREELTEEQKEVVKTAHSASTHMAETIKAMLTISHIETGEVNPELENMNVRTAIDAVARLYDGERKQKHISLTVHCPKNIVLYTDEQLFKEVLSNLLINAYKYTPKDGTVDITVKAELNRINIDIADTGCGISLRDQKHIAQKFFRASNAAELDPEGSGLGLHMTYSLMQLLGGTISFISEEHSGTTFSLSFPHSL